MENRISSGLHGTASNGAASCSASKSSTGSRNVLAHALPLAAARWLRVASAFTVYTRASIAGFAFPYIVPSSVFWQSDVVAPSNRITVGVVGCGGQGTDRPTPSIISITRIGRARSPLRADFPDWWTTASGSGATPRGKAQP